MLSSFLYKILKNFKIKILSQFELKSQVIYQIIDVIATVVSTDRIKFISNDEDSLQLVWS